MKDKYEEKTESIIRFIENLKNWNNRKAFDRYCERKEIKQIRKVYMEEFKNKTLEELKEIREELIQAWIIQRSEYQEEKLEKVNEEIEKRKTKSKVDQKGYRL